MENIKSTKNLLLPKVVLKALLILPLFATVSYSTRQINLGVALIQLLFVTTVFSETVKELVGLMVKSIGFRLAAIAIAVIYCIWLVSGMAVFEIDRSLCYPVELLFFAAMVFWFRNNAQEALLLIGKVKIGLLIFAMLFMYFHVFYVLTGSNYLETDFFNFPPIYKHLRHMNYDVAIALGFIVFLYSRSQGVKRYFYLLMLFLCGFFTVWSAGRGQMLSFVLFLVLVIFLRIEWATVKKLLVAVASFAAGGASVFFTSHTHYISQRNVLVGGESGANQLSSNRLVLWQKAIAKLQEDYGWLIGYGPDAWIRLKVAARMHPHNFIIQWLFEFGAPVTLLLLFIIYRSIVYSINLARVGSEFTLDKMVAALLISTYFYALFDGQFYHAIPLTMILIMGAYLYARLLDLSLQQ